MNNTTQGPTDSTSTTNLNFWGAETAKGEIEKVKGELFFGGKEISWRKLAVIEDIGIYRLIQACLSSDYRTFIRSQFTEYLDEQARTQSPQILTAAPDTTIPKEPKKETVQTGIGSIDNKSLQEENIATSILHSPQEPETLSKQTAIATPDATTPEGLENEAILTRPITPVLDLRQEPEAPSTQTPIEASENASLETTPKSGKPSESIEIANTQIRETPSNALLTAITIKLSNPKINLAGLTKIKKDLDRIIESDPEIKADSLFKEIKASLKNSIIKAERHLLDERLIGQFTSGNMSLDAAHTRKLVGNVIADVHKDFSGTIGEYRMKVIHATVSNLLDEAKDNSEALGALKNKLNYVKGELDTLFNVSKKEKGLDLTEDTDLVKMIDKLLQTIETAETEAKTKEAAAAKAKEAVAAKATSSIITGIKEKINDNSNDLTALIKVRQELDAIVDSNPNIKTDIRLEETKEQLESSIIKAIRPILIGLKKEIIANNNNETALLDIKTRLDAIIESNPAIKTLPSIVETQKHLTSSIQSAHYLETGEAPKES